MVSTAVFWLLRSVSQWIIWVNTKPDSHLCRSIHCSHSKSVLIVLCNIFTWCFGIIKMHVLRIHNPFCKLVHIMAIWIYWILLYSKFIIFIYSVHVFSIDSSLSRYSITVERITVIEQDSCPLSLYCMYENFRVQGDFCAWAVDVIFWGALTIAWLVHSF